MNKRNIAIALAVMALIASPLFAGGEKESEPDRTYFVEIGDHLLSEGKYDAAIIAYDKALKISNTREAREGREKAIAARDANKQQQQQQQQREQQQREERQREADRGYIRLYSVYAGTVLLNGKATEFTVKAGEEVRVIVENAKDKEYTVAVRDANGTVRQAGKVTIKVRGLIIGITL
jgi:biotin carboxyl carrier protein